MLGSSIQIGGGSLIAGGTATGDVNFNEDIKMANGKFLYLDDDEDSYIKINADGDIQFWIEAALNLRLQSGQIQLPNLVKCGSVIEPQVNLEIRSRTADNSYVDFQAYDVDGTAYVSIMRIQNADDPELGFFGATPIAKQTVAADAGAIQTALVNLGLITAA